jgi:nucleoside-diphosphate-sugar epimerase
MIDTTCRFNNNSILAIEKPDLAGQRILITGINGFMGCNMAVTAERLGAEVIGVGLNNTTARADRIRASLGGKKCYVHEVACLNMYNMSNLLAKYKVDKVIHLAGSINRGIIPEAWIESVERNVLLTAAVISAISLQPESSRPVLVMAGSQMEYGLASMPWVENRAAMPDNPYGAGKLAATELIRAATRSNVLRGCVVRFPLVFGPGQSPTMIIPEVICKAMRNIDINLTEGRQQRRFIFVEDAVKFLLMVSNFLSSNTEIPSLINSSASDPLSIVEIVRKVMIYLPNSIKLRIGVLANRPNERMQAWPDSTIADSMGLVSLTPIESGLSLTVDWYMQNKWFVDSMNL